MTLSLLSMLAACATRPMLAACATAVLAVAATLPLSSAANSTLTVNTAVTPRQVSPDLWGVFFEELNHAGEGGLYSQEIQNTAFESKRVTPWTSFNATGVTYDLSISTAVPVTVESPHSLQVTTTLSADADTSAATLVGVSNGGYWGISTANHSSFKLDMWAYSSTITGLTAWLHSADGATVYAQADVPGVTANWTRLTATLTLKNAVADPHAVFSLTWASSGATDSVFLDVVTLFPGEGWRGLPFIRADLADMIADIHPSIVRMPGGSYIDGVDIAGRYEWNNTLYGHEHRPGHANLWGYWGEDGLGIYELFSWAEKMTDVYGNKPRVVWVVNAGISYGGEVIRPDQLDAWVQDAINSIEFATGATSTPYGAIRAEMGHPEPFELHYIAIGNENCQGSGAPTYPKYYPVFYSKIKAAYPDINVLANCNEPSLGAFSLYEYHTYPSPQQFYGMEHTFDNFNVSEKIFVSEYAARGRDAGNGTIDAALSEAVFMNGMERNSHVVKLASYAPLFANANGFEWLPDAVYFTSSEAFGTPSYWTQHLYANSFRGLSGAPMTVNYTVASDSRLSASVTVGTLSSQFSSEKAGAGYAYIVKLVNAADSAATVSVDMQGLPSGATFPAASDLALLASPTGMRDAANSFAAPLYVSPQYSTVDISSGTFSVDLPAWSLAALRVYVTVPSEARSSSRLAALVDRLSGKSGSLHHE